jgi:twitching motility protein PilJ
MFSWTSVSRYLVIEIGHLAHPEEHMAFKLNMTKSSSNAKEGGNPAATARPGPSGARSPVVQQLQLLGFTLLLLLVAIGVLVEMDSRISARKTVYTATASHLGMLSQRIARAAGLALQGDPLAFGNLRDAHRMFVSDLERLKNGGELGGMFVPPSPENAAPQLDDVASLWTRVGRNIQQLLKSEEKVAVFGKYLRGFGIGAERDANAGKRAQDAALDEETRKLVTRLDIFFEEYNVMFGGILGSIQELPAARQAVGGILADDTGLLDATDALAQAYRQYGGDEQTIYRGALAASVLLVVIVLAMMSRAFVRDARRQTELAEKSRQESEVMNRQNQDAILRLMNELGDLADGDLTVTATVSEDITGAIADSINYTVEELRVLVGRINDAASRVTGATEIAQRTSVELLDATRRQSREIQEAGHSVLEVAKSMTRASGDANQSAQVARHSLAAAGKGAQAVQDSIKGMNEIREQIQETSKRIKRLGESSQEIGEIVELISDITEQTNVLALNAAIQAASAGDAGRGFTIVAEEVQRLAERSGEATKQIAAIVKTIQTDTQGAVSAMERSTHGVVEGAKLSDAAGQALAEIGAVSRNLSELIERISEATRQQADAATGVAGKMQNILKVTDQTTTGTQRAANVVGELAGLATELKGSVAGFKVG